MITVKKKSTGRPRKYDLPSGKGVVIKNTTKTRLEEARKDVVFPEPGELVKTSDELCSYCKDCAILSGCLVMCDYVSNHHELRGCVQGECDKFDRRPDGKRKNNWLDYKKVPTGVAKDFA